jgi:polyferredoxin
VAQVTTLNKPHSGSRIQTWWRKWTRRRIWVRSLVQVFFFILVASIAVNHTLAETGQAIPFLANASIHAVCPFGGVETLYQLVTAGTLVNKVHDSALVLLGLTLLLSILAGPVLCGWVCPLGTIQEWFGKLGRKLFKRRYNTFVPEKLDRGLRYLRYGVLAWVLYMTAISATLFFDAYDPFSALFHFWSTEVALGGIIVLVVTLALSLLVERPWCKYACPFGAVLGLTNLFRVFTIRRVEGTCKLDGACNRACPMNIPVSRLKTIRDHQCISCLECTTEASCPAAGTVDLTLGGK